MRDQGIKGSRDQGIIFLFPRSLVPLSLVPLFPLFIFAQEAKKDEAKAPAAICLTQGPCCKQNDLNKRVECLAGDRLKKATDPVAKIWVEANAALSDIYYAEMIDKSADPNVKNLWQNAFGLLYKSMDIMKKGTYPSQGIGGEGVDIATLLPYYTETQGQLRNALDALYTTQGIASSLDGRGRRVFPQLELLYQQLEKIRIASSRKDVYSYEQALDGFCRMSRVVWLTLCDAAPVKYSEVVGAYPAMKKQTEALIRSGVKFVFTFSIGILVAVFFFMRMPRIGAQDILERSFERLSTRAKSLANEYNRQFLGVGAGWLLYGPMIVSVIFGLLTMSILVFALAAFVFVYLLPTEGLKFIKERRRLKIESQLLDSLILLSDAMKSGLDLAQGLELAVHEMVPPISEEFDLMLKNYKLGMSFDEALKTFDRRVDSDLVSYVVRAIMIQRQTGGNLTKIFDRIVDTIREEGKLKDKINALTAGPRMQSIVISIIPWGMLMVLYFFQPEAVGSFFTSMAGIVIILLCVFWQTIGLIVIRKLAKIEV
ncbi:MAG: type II secretion system F family protein [Elusimicrobia bacterium]|nr:type II secretion system F family protein [Elusimicrobiota bacterium]